MGTALKTNRPAKTHLGAEGGFSVLEALVAMAVLAGALLPLLSLQSQFVRTTQTLERNEIRMATHSLAIEHISPLNFDQSAAGSLKTRHGSVKWKAVPAAGPHPGRGTTGFPSRYVVTLYNISVDIEYIAFPPETLTLQGMGWHPTVSIYDTF